MSSSPRFWQKLGLGKQHKSSNNVNSDNASIHSISSQQQKEESLYLENNKKQVKRFSSTISLRHKSSSVSLYQQSLIDTPEQQLRRTSYIKPLRRIDPVDIKSKPIENTMTAVNIDYNTPGGRTSPVSPTSKQPFTRLPTSATYHQPLLKKQSFIDLNSSRLPSRLKRTKSNQSMIVVPVSNRPSTDGPPQINHNTNRLRPLSPAKNLVRKDSTASFRSPVLSKKKSLVTFSSSEDEVTDISDSPTSDRKSPQPKMKSTFDRSVTTAVQTEDMTDENLLTIKYLQEELENERSLARTMQGQKEAIAKDLDYFYKMVDDITEEKDEFKKKYEEELNQNKSLREKVADLESRSYNKTENSIKEEIVQSSPQSKIELENLHQRMLQDQQTYHHNLQSKNDEINRLKNDYKQSQRQIQILRKTMEQLLKVDGKDSYDDNFEFDEDIIRARSSLQDYYKREGTPESRSLLLQAGYHPDQHDDDVLTNPPSPLPIHSIATSHTDDDDLFSTTSKDSNYSYKSKLKYDFLQSDSHDEDYSYPLSKRKSQDFAKKIALSRRRKNQLEEMLGEVDSQLNRVKQKMRPTS